MGVLTNGYRDKIGVFRTYGGTFHNNSFPQGTLGNYNLTGMKRNLTAGEGITDAKVGVPMGYVAKGWQLPQKAGMISSRAGTMTVGASGTMLSGFPISGSTSFSVSFSDAFGQLIASGGGEAALLITTNSPLLTASIGGTGTASILINTNTPTLGALADGMGSTGFTVSFAPVIAYPLNDASPLRTGASSLSINGVLIPYAKGFMVGSTADLGLTVAGITNAVWSAPLAGYTEAGTAGKALAAASSGGVDYEALGLAVWTSVTRTLTSSSGAVPTATEVADAVWAKVLP